MAKGRKAKPHHLKVVTGNPGKRPLSDDTIQAPIEIPEPPKCLSKLGAKVWPEILPELAKLGVIARVDVHTIATYCNIVARMTGAQAVIDELGETYETVGKHGKMFRQRPELKTVLECEAKLARYAAEFGMTSASRARLKGDPRQGSLPLNDPTAGIY